MMTHKIVEDAMKYCPACYGKGKWHISNLAPCDRSKEDCNVVSMTCPLCDGTGEVPQNFGVIQ